MAVGSLLVKDYLEHRWAALMLAVASLLVVLVLLEQNQAAAYSMSPFEIVRFALLGFFPLTALIVGNRLIVREYLSGTRLFVEALPIGSVMPLILKYLLGFVFLALVCIVMVLLAANQAGVADDVTPDYVLLIFGKALVMISLYWSIVFVFSLCGYLRIALYLVLAAIIAFIAFFPGLDSSRFAPFALMDKDLFVYERDIVPWRDMALTLMLSAALTCAGFVLTRLGEGSVLERLAKPMTRRDYVALGILCAAGLSLWVTLLEKNSRESIDFSSVHVVRLNDPDISVHYISDEYQPNAQSIAERLSSLLAGLQSTLALQSLPTVRLILSPSSEKHDIDYATSDGVLVTANWLEHDSFDLAVLEAVVLHGVLSISTGGRAMFEPYHWVLDGFTRWWAEQGQSPINDSHRHELIARALLVLDRQDAPVDLIHGWQQLADRHSYPSAEALAWAAMNYIEEEFGRDAVIKLAWRFLREPVGSTAVESFRDRLEDVQSRMEAVLQMDLQSFDNGWRQWLENRRQLPAVQTLLRAVPPVKGKIVAQTDADGVHQISAYYHLLPAAEPSYQSDQDAQCVLKHDYLGPFDTEFTVTDDFEIVGTCQTEGVAHTIDSTYAPGDRVYIALDFESSYFHLPVRLHVERLYVQ